MKSWISRDESLTNPHITPDIHAAGADFQKDVVCRRVLQTDIIVRALKEDDEVGFT